MCVPVWGTVNRMIGFTELLQESFSLGSVSLDHDVTLHSLSVSSVAGATLETGDIESCLLTGRTYTLSPLLITSSGDSESTPPACSSLSLIAERIHTGHTVLSKFATAAFPLVSVTGKAITCPCEFSNRCNRERSWISIGTESESFASKTGAVILSISTSLPRSIHVKWPLEGGDIAPLPAGRAISTDGLVLACLHGRMGFLSSVEDPQLCHRTGLTVFARDSIESGDDSHYRLPVDLARAFVNYHDHCSAIAAATGSKNLERSLPLSGDGGMFHTRCQSLYR